MGRAMRGAPAGPRMYAAMIERGAAFMLRLAEMLAG